MGIAYAAFYLSVAWKWGDWRNWKHYYPTMLFFIGGDLLYHYLFCTYPMWKFHPIGIDYDIHFPDKLIPLSIMLVKYPATLLVYLGRYPKNLHLQVLHLLLWVTIYTLNEVITLSFAGIKHYHNWNLGWSLFFNIVMFLILRVHHTKPLLAWGYSFLFIILLWQLLHVPIAILHQ